MENLRFLHLNWDEVQGLTEIVAGKIIASDFRPDLIVAVSRGGFDPARILCDQLGVRRLASVQLEAYDGMVKRPEPVVVFQVNADVAGLKVLIADDVSDSGASLLKAKEYIKGKEASSVRLATLHIKPWSRFVPDYYAESVDAWVVYPWELRECLIEVAEKLRTTGLRGRAIAEKLVEVGFKERDIARYLRL
jgi:hypoxanthine phosphoribosyltransferase